MSATIHVTTNSPASLAATTDKFVHAISPTVELNDVENGTELIVTDINGEHSAVIHDGYTPQRGVDYWTEEDQAETREVATEAAVAAVADVAEVVEKNQDRIEVLERPVPLVMEPGKYINTTYQGVRTSDRTVTINGNEYSYYWWSGWIDIRGVDKIRVSTVCGGAAGYAFRKGDLISRFGGTQDSTLRTYLIDVPKDMEYFAFSTVLFGQSEELALELENAEYHQIYMTAISDGAHYSYWAENILRAVQNAYPPYEELLEDDVMCIGDSLTYGSVPSGTDGIGGTTTPYHEWLKAIGAFHGHFIVNAISGYSASDWYQYLDEIAPSFAQCGTFLIWLGTNHGPIDVLDLNEQPEGTETYYYRKIIERIILERPDAKIFLGSVFASKDTVPIVNGIIREIAWWYSDNVIGVTNFDDGTMFGPEEKSLHGGSETNPHFTPSGYFFVATKWLGEIRRLIASKLDKFPNTITPRPMAISPTVAVETITNGHKVTITDAEGTHVFNVMDGQAGRPGDPGKDGEDYVLTEQDKAEIAQMTIDDTAAAGTTDKTWSADKIAAEIAAGTGVLVELNIARDGTVTTEASVADILADIEAGKHVYGLGHIEGKNGITITAYAPMLAIDIAGNAAAFCTFNVGEAEIMVSGMAMGNTDMWQMRMQIAMKVATTSLEDEPESFDAMDLPISNVGAPVNATDAATKQYVDEHAGGGTVTDVQVNGTSIVTEGVANVPIGKGTTLGVVRIDGNGLSIGNSGAVSISPSGDAVYKAGTSYVAPVAAAKQHISTFYGLAKASGDTTQSQSSNAVGTYTDNAKASIQSMLGVSSMLAPSETEGSGASRNYAIGETFTMNGKLYKATIAITENDVITSGVNCAETNVADSKADKTDTVLNTTLSMGRKTGTTVGYGSTALGSSVEASGSYSFATGYNTKASGSYAHAEGQNTEATQTESHAEGNYTHATNTAAHAEGNNTNAKGYYSHAEGNNTNANYEAAHAEGSYTTAGYKAHSEGYYTVATGEGSHAEGGYSQATQEYSHAEGYQTTASGQHSHSEGSSTTASGNYSHAEGYATQATVLYAHAEGTATLAAAPEAHAEGGYTKATNEAAHAEGGYTEASGYYSHAEGYQTKASGANAHAEGFYTIAPGRDSHASGRYNKMDLYPDWVSGTEYKVGDCVLYSFTGYKCKTANTDENFTASKWDQLPTNSPVAMAIGNGESENARSNALTVGWNGSLAHGVNVNASGEGSYASGIGSTASGVYTHAEGYATQATNTASHAEGIQSQSTHQGSHAEGISSFATGAGAHAEGNGGATASNSGAHAEGTGTTASGLQSHAEGMGSRATGDQAHAEGSGTNAVGGSAHSEGGGTRAEGGSSHAEGGGSQAVGYASHAEGTGSRATGAGSHAEGGGSEASGMDAHAEGCGTIASANYSHASGIYNVAMTLYPDWVANTTYKVGDRVNKGGSGYECITENSDAAWAASKWKERPSNSDTAFVIGNGTFSTRSNAMELKWNGDMALQGDMTLFKGTANEFNVSSLSPTGLSVVNGQLCISYEEESA